MKKYKLLIFIVAYNHEKTIESVIKRIPKKLANLYDLEILIIDDASSDKTFEISKKIQRNQINNNLKVKVFYNPRNPAKSFLIKPSKIGFFITLLCAVLPVIYYINRFH